VQRSVGITLETRSRILIHFASDSTQAFTTLQISLFEFNAIENITGWVGGKIFLRIGLFFFFFKKIFKIVKCGLLYKRIGSKKGIS